MSSRKAGSPKKGKTLTVKAPRISKGTRKKVIRTALDLAPLAIA